MYAQQCSEIHITKFQLLPTGFLFIINPPRRKKTRIFNEKCSLKDKILTATLLPFWVWIKAHIFYEKNRQFMAWMKLTCKSRCTICALTILDIPWILIKLHLRPKIICQKTFSSSYTLIIAHILHDNEERNTIKKPMYLYHDDDDDDSNKNDDDGENP